MTLWIARLSGRRTAPLTHLLCWALLASWSLGSEAAETETTHGYGVQPGDILAVSVWQEPDLERLVLVRPDGGISYPLVGEVTAQGRTVEELGKEITERLEAFIADPVVTVTLQEIPGNRIYILGRVNRPGDFVIARNVTVMQALAMAGGLTPFAAEKKIQVLRAEDGQQRTIPFNYKQVERGEDLEQNITLQAGDVVVVP